jgi:DnaJ like chaperone protein
VISEQRRGAVRSPSEATIVSTPVLLALLLLAIAVGFAVRMGKRRESAPGRNARSFQDMNIPPESRAAFIVCVFSMLGKLAEADKHVSPEEAAKIESYIDSHLRLDRETRALALRVFGEAAISPLELRDYAEKFRKTYPERYRLCDSIIEILVELSVADGVLSIREDELIRSAALVLGMTEPAYQGIKAKHVRVGQLAQ